MSAAITMRRLAVQDFTGRQEIWHITLITNIYIERCSVNTRRNGVKIYYRSQAFWQASAAVNLPAQIDNEQYQGLNGFNERCCAYGSAIAVLTEQKFPDSNNFLVNEEPESEQLRRG